MLMLTNDHSIIIFWVAKSLGIDEMKLGLKP
jgi:cation transport ATPase